MKFISIAISLLALTVSAAGQEAGPSLEISARSFASKISAMDSLAVASMLPDEVIKTWGGTEAIASEVEKLYEPLRRNSIKTLVKLARPSALGKEGSSPFAFVPYMQSMTMPNGVTVNNYSYFLAISADDGQTWKFVEGNLPPAVFNRILPHYSGTPAKPGQLPYDQYQ